MSCSCCLQHNKLICYSATAQIILAFCIGILLGPWSYGYIFLIAGIIIGELIWIFWVYGYKDYQNHWKKRLGVLIASLLGWVISRLITKNSVTESGHKRLFEWLHYIGWRDNKDDDKKDKKDN